MWQSKRIKHWLGSTSQKVIVNRKSGLSGSISRGVSEIALGPQITNCLKGTKQKTVIQWSTWHKALLGTHSDLGHSKSWAGETLCSRESPSTQMGKKGLDPASFLLLQPFAHSCQRSPWAHAPLREGGETVIKYLNCSCPLWEAY